MDLNTLQNWLWRAASSIRGEADAARYKDYILPLVFYKRMDDVYADELARVAKTLEVDAATATGFVEADRSLVRFFFCQIEALETAIYLTEVAHKNACESRIRCGWQTTVHQAKRSLRVEVDEDAWQALYSTVSRPFDRPKSRKIAVKVINHYGDEVLKVYAV